MSMDSATAIRAFLAAGWQQQVAFVAELVRVPSDNPPGDCAPHAARAAVLLEALGLTVERHPYRRTGARQRHGQRHQPGGAASFR